MHDEDGIPLSTLERPLSFDGCCGDTGNPPVGCIHWISCQGTSRWKNYCARLVVHVQVTTFGPARGDDEIILDGACLWRVTGHVKLDAVLVQLSLEVGIINVAFCKQVACLSVDGAICPDLPIRPSVAEGGVG